jgi:hypothetical protein
MKPDVAPYNFDDPNACYHKIDLVSFQLAEIAEPDTIKKDPT